METADATRLMIILAVATPALALLVHVVTGHMATAAGEPVPADVRRNVWILAFAGPVNFGLWWAFNHWLHFMGSRSVAGYILAALAFILAGTVTGFFGRLSGRTRDNSSER